MVPTLGGVSFHWNVVYFYFQVLCQIKTQCQLNLHTCLSDIYVHTYSWFVGDNKR